MTEPFPEGVVLIKNEYKIGKSIKINTFEAIYFQLQINNLPYNFVSCYKSPNDNNENFLCELDDFIFSLNLEENLLIIGDLNMDLLVKNEQSTGLMEFMLANNLDQAVTQPTRVCTKFYSKTKKYSCSKTLIDVIIFNNELVKEVFNIRCGFSDHMFVLSKLKLTSVVKKENYFIGRNLSKRNIETIAGKIAEANLNEIIKLTDSNDKWLKIKNRIPSITDQIAPIKEIKIKNYFNYPWVDAELIEARKQRDKTHKIHFKSQLELDFLLANEAKSIYNSLLKSKMIEYFKDKSTNDFKCSKKFWEFYSHSNFFLI